MLYAVVAVLLILWLLGAFGIPGRIQPFAGGSSLIHVILVIVVVLLLFRLL